MQSMDEEKAKLDAFCEQSLKEVRQVQLKLVHSYYTAVTYLSSSYAK